MSLTTHRFSSYQTLARAKDWLGRLGIEPEMIEVSSTGLPSMTVQTDFSRMPEVEMIINAAELSDPAGWPAWDDLGVYQPPIEVRSAPAEPDTTQTAPIGWHPVD